jgi:hypothetical protein
MTALSQNRDARAQRAARRLISSGVDLDNDGRLFTEAEIIAALAKHYPTGFATIGALCDETLDRSGCLLGKVRAAARNLSK